MSMNDPYECFMAATTSQPVLPSRFVNNEPANTDEAAAQKPVIFLNPTDAQLIDIFNGSLWGYK